MTTRTGGEARERIERAAKLARETIDGNVWTATVGEDPAQRTMLLAGTGKFDALWARDACYAGRGALVAGRADAVEGTLETLLDHQFPDGLVPRRIGASSTEWAAILFGIGLHRARRPRFDTIDRGSPSQALGISHAICPDANMLVIALAREYVERTGDVVFLEEYFGKLEAALGWLRTQVREGFLEQAPIADWKDTVDRGRVVFYNQVLYFQAMRAMAALERRRGDPGRADGHDAAALVHAERVRERFWDRALGFFRDSEAIPGFSPDGNLIAIECGFARPKEAERIFAHVDALLARGPLLPAADPLYPEERVPLLVRMAGMRLYHDGMAWPWQDCMHAIAAARTDDPARAVRALDAVATLALRDGGFYEVYEGNPPRIVKRRFYLSEPGFSWSAGLYLKACAELGIV